jgi:CheY-like chemotaxis protein
MRSGDNSPTILVAEDEPSFRRVFAAYLRDKGFNVLAAEDGKEALQLLKERRVDLVVLDLHMPGLSGKGVLASIRTRPDLAALPVIVLTATASAGLEEELRPFVQEWLTKSKVKLADVEAAIRRHLGQRASLGGVPAPK